ncbi:MAG: cytochrome C oxidase subunit II [Gaiella sp.]
MGQTAVVITVAYAIAVVIGSAIAFVIWRSTFDPDPASDTHTWSRRETTWLVIVVVGLFALLLGTIFYVPYGESAGPRKQVVRVTGVQFAWALAPTELRAGVPVEFQLRTRDVNHGFAIYDPDGNYVTQAQVIPDQTQTLVWTFDESGTYEVLCLEFCGAKHHEMLTQFEVVG